MIAARLAAGAVAVLVAATGCRQSSKPAPGETSAAQTSPSPDSGGSRGSRQATEAASVTTLVLAPASPSDASAPDATSANAPDPEAPSNDECRRAKRDAVGEAKTQAEMTTQAAAGAVLAACDEHRAREALAQKLAPDPKATLALADSQRKWRAFLEAHEAERSPHED